MTDETLTLENLRISNDFRDNLDWRLDQWVYRSTLDDEKKNDDDEKKNN